MTNDYERKVRLCVNAVWRRLNPYSLKKFKVCTNEV